MLQYWYSTSEYGSATNVILTCVCMQYAQLVVLICMQVIVYVNKTPCKAYTCSTCKVPGTYPFIPALENFPLVYLDHYLYDACITWYFIVNGTNG